MSERVSRWPSVMRIVVPLCLLGLVFWSLDFHALLETFAGMAARDLLLGTALGLLLVQLQIVLSAWRWHTTATSLGQALSLSDAVREYYLSTLVNQSLPGGVVGDAARVVRSRQQSGIAVAAQSVLIERMAGQVVLALLVVVGLIAWPFVVDAARPVGAWTLLASVLVVALLLCTIVFVGQRLTSGRIGRFAASLWPALQRAWFANGAWQVQLLLSLAIVSSYLALFAVAALTLGAPLPWIGLLTIVPLTLLTMLLPISVGGWGVREAAAAILWPIVGLTAESGVATSVLYGLLCLAGSLPGGLFVVRRAGRTDDPLPSRQ